MIPLRPDRSRVDHVEKVARHLPRQPAGIQCVRRPSKRRSWHSTLWGAVVKPTRCHSGRGARGLPVVRAAARPRLVVGHGESPDSSVPRTHSLSAGQDDTVTHDRLDPADIPPVSASVRRRAQRATVGRVAPGVSTGIHCRPTMGCSSTAGGRPAHRLRTTPFGSGTRTMGNIGTERREIEFEPLPEEPRPESEPRREQPQPQPEPAST